jgi:hypothetical protein
MESLSLRSARVFAAKKIIFWTIVRVPVFVRLQSSGSPLHKKTNFKSQIPNNEGETPSDARETRALPHLNGVCFPFNDVRFPIRHL